MTMTAEQNRVFDVFTSKPAWMKEAELSKRGWVNPKTGELLLGRRTPDWVFEELAKQAQPTKEEIPEPVVAVETVAEETPAPEEVVEEKGEEVPAAPVEAPKATKSARRGKKG